MLKQATLVLGNAVAIGGQLYYARQAHKEGDAKLRNAWLMTAGIQTLRAGVQLYAQSNDSKLFQSYLVRPFGSRRVAKMLDCNN